MEAILTGDDLALAESSVQLAMAWWRDKPDSDFRADQLKKLDALNRKLSAISCFAYPYEFGDEMPDDIGSEPIMTLQRSVVARTRAAARRAAA